MPAKIPIWLDCDPGHDDAFAILLTAYHPNLELLGVSTVHGNSSLDHVTDNALRTLTAIGCPQIPVHRGSARPFSRDAVYAPDIHGDSGLEGTSLLPTPTCVARDEESEPAILAMRNAILSRPDNTVWVVATGAWTNAALLFVAFPDLAKRVAGVTMMGGAIGGGFSKALMAKIDHGVMVDWIGNVTKWAEFNVYCDPESSKSLLCNPHLQGKMVMIPLDITHLALINEKVKKRLLRGDTLTPFSERPPHPMRQMFHDLLTFFASTYRDVFGFRQGPPLHDPLAVAVILDMLGLEDFGFEDGQNEGEKGGEWIMNVITKGEHQYVMGAEDGGQLGRTVLLRPAKDGEYGVRVPRRIKHLEKFWDSVELALEAAEKQTEGTGMWEK